MKNQLHAAALFAAAMLAQSVAVLSADNNERERELSAPAPDAYNLATTRFRTIDGKEKDFGEVIRWWNEYAYAWENEFREALFSPFVFMNGKITVPGGVAPGATDSMGIGGVRPSHDPRLGGVDPKNMNGKIIVPSGPSNSPPSQEEKVKGQQVNRWIARKNKAHEKRDQWYDFRVYGKVMQVLDGASLIQLYRGGTGHQMSAVVFLKNHPDQNKLVDGDFVDVVAQPVGRTNYVNTAGARSTVKLYDFGIVTKK